MLFLKKLKTLTYYRRNLKFLIVINRRKGSIKFNCSLQSRHKLAFFLAKNKKNSAMLENLFYYIRICICLLLISLFLFLKKITRFSFQTKKESVSVRNDRKQKQKFFVLNQFLWENVVLEKKY